MREIKFRGIAKETNGWVYGYYYHRAYDDKHIIKDVLTGSKTEIYPETRGQYTGMRDVNCKEIYEGDIIKTQYRTSPIAFHNNAFKAKSGTYGWDDMDRLSMPTVIGTIHDGKYGMSEEDKKILEAHIQILKGIQGELRNLGLNYKTVDVNSVIGCINDAMSAIYEIKEVKE